MATSTTRLTFGALLGTVNTAATTLTSTLDAAGSAVGMLNAFVDKAAKEQRIRHKVDTNEFKNRLVNETAMARAQREKQVIAFCKDPESKELYAKAHDELMELLKDD